MISEKIFLEALQNNGEVKRIIEGAKIYLGEAPKGAGDNLLVLNAITQGAIMEAGTTLPLYQLDVYHKDKFRAIEIADSLNVLFFREQMTVGNYFLAFRKIERLREEKCEDGTYRVPLEIKLLIKEIV